MNYYLKVGALVEIVGPMVAKIFDGVTGETPVFLGYTHDDPSRITGIISGMDLLNIELLIDGEIIYISQDDSCALKAIS